MSVMANAKNKNLDVFTVFFSFDFPLGIAFWKNVAISPDKVLTQNSHKLHPVCATIRLALSYRFYGSAASMGARDTLGAPLKILEAASYKFINSMF